MKKVLIAPRKYVQGPGVLDEIGDYVSIVGKRPLVLWDSTVRGLVGDTILASLNKAGLEAVEVDFQGESSHAEADRVGKIADENNSDVSIGVGGGKTLDIAKAVGIEKGIGIITCPTIASNDSPTSAATVWYDDDGNFINFDCWTRNPDLVIVDSRVVANGPTRAFVSGMGDALATWVEAKAAYNTRPLNLAGGVSTLAAMAIAELGYEILMEYGVEAKRAVDNNLVTPAIEKVLEANVLHSGLGFESGGLATAHMVANCLPSFPECHGLMHGEEVGFGVITQLCLDDDMGTDEMYDIVDFEIAVGLPVTFADLGLDGVSQDRLEVIGDTCAGEGSLCGSHSFEVTSEGVVDAMMAADALGHERKGLLGAE